MYSTVVNLVLWVLLQTSPRETDMALFIQRATCNHNACYGLYVLLCIIYDRPVINAPSMT